MGNRISPSSSIKTRLLKSHPDLPFALRSAPIPVSSYIAPHFTDWIHTCLCCTVMCTKQIKVFGESFCSFSFYMMWYSVFAEAVLTDRVKNIYLP